MLTPAAPSAITSFTVATTASIESPIPARMSAVTGTSTASTISAIARSITSRGMRSSSTKPWLKATPALPVPTARMPAASNTRALAALPRFMPRAPAARPGRCSSSRRCRGRASALRSAIFCGACPCGPSLVCRSLLRAHGASGELLDQVEQASARLRRALFVAGGDRSGDVGVQLGGERHVGGLLVVEVPEAARQRVHQAHRPRRELVVRRRRAEDVEVAVDAHERDVVFRLGGRLERGGDGAKALALVFGG